MKTTIELPDPLLRQAKLVAARNGTTMRELIIEGLKRVLGQPLAPKDVPLVLNGAEAEVAEVGPHGLPVLKRTKPMRKRPVKNSLIKRLREELSI